jgi:hypothetical protein
VSADTSATSKTLWQLAVEQISQSSPTDCLLIERYTNDLMGGGHVGQGLTGDSFLEDLIAAAEKKQQESMQNKWKFNLNGRQIVLQDVANKIITWLDKFKQVGDIAVNFDPVQSALPWAAIRFLLQVFLLPEPLPISLDNQSSRPP